MTATPLSALIGSIAIDAGNKACAIGHPTPSTNFNLDEGSYYFYSPDTDECLLYQICSKASAAFGHTINYSISDDGHVTFSSANAFNLSMPSLYAILGFLVDGGDGTESVADQQMRYCWFPGLVPARTSAPGWGSLEFLSQQQRALDATIYTSKVATFVRQQLSYRFLVKARTWNASNTNESFEEFCHDVISQGRYLLYYPSWDSDRTDCWQYKPDLMTDKGDETILITPTRTDPSRFGDLRWDVTIALQGT